MTQGTEYPTASGRTIAEIGAWAANYAAGREDESAASAVISVAVGQIVGVGGDVDNYSPTLFLTGDLMRGRLTGAAQAQWSIDNFPHSTASRDEHAARLRAVADVIEASGVQLDQLSLAVTELRAYANVYSPSREI